MECCKPDLADDLQFRLQLGFIRQSLVGGVPTVLLKLLQVLLREEHVRGKSARQVLMKVSSVFNRGNVNLLRRTVRCINVICV